jgi:hypothetical protein
VRPLAAARGLIVDLIDLKNLRRWMRVACDRRRSEIGTQIFVNRRWEEHREL